MTQARILLSTLSVLAFASGLAGCKATGMHLKEKYPADRVIVASAAEASMTDAVAALGSAGHDAPSHSASIDQLLCAHGFAAHHPYRYLNSCARSGI